MASDAARTVVQLLEAREEVIVQARIRARLTAGVNDETIFGCCKQRTMQDIRRRWGLQPRR